MKQLKLIPVLALAAAAMFTGAIQAHAADTEIAERPLLQSQNQRGAESGQQLQRGQRLRLQQCDVPCCENRQLRRDSQRPRRGEAAKRGYERRGNGEGRGPRN